MFREFKEKLSPLNDELFKHIKEKQILACWAEYWRTINKNEERYNSVLNELPPVAQKVRDLEEKIGNLEKQYNIKPHKRIYNLAALW